MLSTKNNTITMADKKVKPNDPVKVWGTGTSKFIPKGKELTLHAQAAETLIAQGRASKEKIEPDADTKKKGAKAI